MTDRPSVMIAMSGGVDSSVSAALLVELGLRVEAVTMQLVDCSFAGGVDVCCGPDAVATARKTCRRLGIGHRLLDFRKEFEGLVLEPAWREYRAGRTPSPCILCNSRVKFGLLVDYALSEGFDFVATGHHARIDTGGDGRRHLLRGTDERKDQSYFLFDMDERVINRLMFPVGSLTKDEVRAKARSLDLPGAERTESTDACFRMEGRSFSDTLRFRFGEAVPDGRILDEHGNLLGRHDGVHRFTIGQRRGLGVELGRRAWVCEIDGRSGDVTVCTDEDALLSKGLVATDPVWTGRDGGWSPDFPVRCLGKIRYRHRAAPCIVEAGDDGRLRLEFDVPQRAVTPGQALVLYEGDRVLGGAWIACSSSAMR